MLGGFCLAVYLDSRLRNSGWSSPANILKEKDGAQSPIGSDDFETVQSVQTELQTIDNSGSTLSDHCNNEIDLRMLSILDDSITQLDIAADTPPSQWKLPSHVVEMVTDSFSRFNTDNNELLGQLKHDLGHAMDVAQCEDSAVEMLPTYVSGFLQKDESLCGKYLGLDLHGLTLRLALLTLNGNTTDHTTRYMVQRTFKIPTSVANSTASQLFDHIAAQLYEFCEQHDVHDADMPMAMTLAFPMRHTGEKTARLLKSKSLGAEGLIDADLVALMQKAIDDRPEGRKLRVRVVACANDTISTLMCAAYDQADGRCDAAVIVSQDTNAAIRQPTVAIPHKMHDSVDKYLHESMIVNCEWCEFGDNQQLEYLLNRFDRQLGEGKRLFSQIVSAKMLGEYVRLLLLELCAVGAAFVGCGDSAEVTFEEPGIFATKYIAEILQDNSEDLHDTRAILQEDVGLEHVLNIDLLLTRQACVAVAKRSAHLLAAAVVAALERVPVEHRNDDGTYLAVVGVDGWLFRQLPDYYDWLVRRMSVINDNDKMQIVVVFNRDQSNGGGARGAALLAAATMQHKR